LLAKLFAFALGFWENCGTVAVGFGVGIGSPPCLDLDRFLWSDMDRLDLDRFLWSDMDRLDMDRLDMDRLDLDRLDRLNMDRLDPPLTFMPDPPATIAF
jgi:hypothetical protein